MSWIQKNYNEVVRVSVLSVNHRQSWLFLTQNRQKIEKYKTLKKQILSLQSTKRVLSDTIIKHNIFEDVQYDETTYGTHSHRLIGRKFIFLSNPVFDHSWPPSGHKWSSSDAIYRIQKSHRWTYRAISRRLIGRKFIILSNPVFDHYWPPSGHKWS